MYCIEYNNYALKEVALNEVNLEQSMDDPMTIFKNSLSGNRPEENVQTPPREIKQETDTEFEKFKLISKKTLNIF